MTLRVPSAVLVAIGVACLVWTGLMVMAWAFQERVLFQPPRWIPAETIAGARRLEYQAVDGTRLFAYIVGDPATAPTLVLAFHGNADLARWQVEWGRRVASETGAAVMLAEYRGYDGNPGTPTYAAAALDARAALRVARDSLQVSIDRVVYFGHSLGSAIAVELAQEAPPRALLLQSPFSSALDMARRMPLPGIAWVWRVVSRIHFDTARRVRDLRVPVWVVHGDRDMIIPASMGKRVFAEASVKGELLLVPGAGHNDVAVRGGAAYWDWLRRGIIGAPAASGATIR